MAAMAVTSRICSSQVSPSSPVVGILGGSSSRPNRLPIPLRGPSSRLEGRPSSSRSPRRARHYCIIAIPGQCLNVNREACASPCSSCSGAFQLHRHQHQYPPVLYGIERRINTARLQHRPEISCPRCLRFNSSFSSSHSPTSYKYPNNYYTSSIIIPPFSS